MLYEFLNSVCGKDNRRRKIIGGTNTEVNEYPWMAAIVDRRFAPEPGNLHWRDSSLLVQPKKWLSIRIHRGVMSCWRYKMLFFSPEELKTYSLHSLFA